MRSINAVKSQEESKSDILCLRKKLTLILDENQSMKVRIRRLENELRRKEKYIECHKTDAQKDRAVGRSFYGEGKRVIDQLQKRNQELEDMLLEKDVQNEKRYNDIRTMFLYSHVDGKINRRGSKISVSNHSRLNSGHRIDPSENSLKQIGSCSRFHLSKKPNRVRSTNSLDERPSSKNKFGSDESSTVMKILQSERIVDKRAIRSKNAEIARLSTELRETKSLLTKQAATKIAKSTSTTELHQRKFRNRDTNLIPANFIEDNKANIRVKRPKRVFDRKTSDRTDRDRRNDSSKLPTVVELNEEINSSNESRRISTFADKKNQGQDISRPKTRIEYVYDSEVSSDDEEFCLPNTLRMFLQRAVDPKSSERKDGAMPAE